MNEARSVRMMTRPATKEPGHCRENHDLLLASLRYNEPVLEAGFSSVIITIASVGRSAYAWSLKILVDNVLGPAAPPILARPGATARLLILVSSSACS